MKKAKLLPLLIPTLFAFGCKKDKTENPPPSPATKVSWWVLNHDTFRTIHTETYINGKVFSLYYFNTTNDTGFSVQIDTLNGNLSNDSFGNYGLYHGTSEANGIFNTHSGSFTIANKDSGSYVYAVRENGKVKITLTPGLYYRWNSNNAQVPQDSAIIQGVFYEE